MGEKKILIVEDNPDSRESLATLLKLEGYTVYTADDGQEGLKLAALDCPDIIITDITMPNVDGIEMVRILRDRPDCNRMPIIVMSAYGSGSLKTAAAAGADEVVAKPFSFDPFLKAIERLLR